MAKTKAKIKAKAKKKQAAKSAKKRIYPLLPLKDIVVFPQMVVPLIVGREKSIRAIENAIIQDNFIFLVSQKSIEEEDPGQNDIYRVGTLAKVIQILKMPDGTIKILVESVERMRIKSYTSEESFFQVAAEPVKPVYKVNLEMKAMMRSVMGLFERYIELNPRIPTEIAPSVSEVDDPELLLDRVAAHLLVKTSDKQKLLDIVATKTRLKKVTQILISEIDILEIEKDISGKVRQQIEKTQKNFYLNEQLKAIERELGKEDFYSEEIRVLERKIKRAKMSKPAHERAIEELTKLERMMPSSPEATVVRNYIDWLIDLPWSKKTKDNLNIDNAQQILDEDHYGLNDPKERILEYLAVKKLSRKMQGPILCLVGPPGVGKTSLAKSVARAMGRKFTKMSLGGVRDEAEIRGHRRTYIGSLPGRILQHLKRAKSKNPVFLLDEVDKMTADFRGDPSSALLEVLDPEQNPEFADHYIEVPFDLSDVFFITTANLEYSIHPTLLDRMEVIRIPGYTEWEKLTIATKYLIPKQLKANGLKPQDVTFTKDALLSMIRQYTREAGLRNLEREIAKVYRKTARKMASEKTRTKVNVSVKQLEKYLGPPKYYDLELDVEPSPGVAHGLAWTQFGGEVLNIETLVMPGKGRLVLTGQLGDVMQESAQAALSYIRSRDSQYGLSPDLFKDYDIHLHVPEGQTPKDGPSAGAAMMVSILSAATCIPLRSDIVMTGEITLRGNILPVGGIKEKALAGHRYGIRKIIIPAKNKSDLAEIPARIRKECEFICVEKIDDVIEHVFTEKFKTVRKRKPKAAAKRKQKSARKKR
jgi:ATP-dependent Lon protease